MKILSAIAPIAVAALGGALAVFGGFDDSPGATLLGILAVLSAMAVGARRARIAPPPDRSEPRP